MKSLSLFRSGAGLDICGDSVHELFEFQEPVSPTVNEVVKLCHFGGKALRKITIPAEVTMLTIWSSDQNYEGLPRRFIERVYALRHGILAPSEKNADHYVILARYEEGIESQMEQLSL